MVEQQRIVDGGMPCGRVMLRKIFHHFKLERDRLGMLGERNLLSLRLNGTSLPELEAFRDKYQYIMTTIPVEDLPKEQTLYNHLIDELDRCTALATKITKSREARADSKKRTCEWLWRQVELALDLEQQKKNRTDFDKLLRSKPGGWGDANVAGAPLVPGAEDKKVDKPKRERKTKKEKKDKGPNGPKGSDNAPQVPGVPAPPKGKPKGKPPPRKATPPATPRTAEATRVAKMTAAEKAKVPMYVLCVWELQGKAMHVLARREQQVQRAAAQGALEATAEEGKCSGRHRRAGNAVLRRAISEDLLVVGHRGRATSGWATTAHARYEVMRQPVQQPCGVLNGRRRTGRPRVVIL